MLKTLLVCVLSGALSLTAAAQGGGGGGGGGRQPGEPRGPGGPGGPPRLSPEKQKAAWELQAKGVSKRAALTDEQTASVVKAYGEARTSHMAAVEKLRQEAGGGGGGGGEGFAELQQKMNAVNKAERDKLIASLEKSLEPEVSMQLVASLGTFNRQWDQMADAVAGFGLEPEQQQTGLNAMEDFVVAQAKARESSGGDRDAMREATQSARQKLMDAMKKLLSEEQFGKFQASMGGGRGRGPGGGGPPGGGGGGGR